MFAKAPPASRLCSPPDSQTPTSRRRRDRHRRRHGQTTSGAIDVRRLSSDAHRPVLACRDDESGVIAKSRDRAAELTIMADRFLQVFDN